MRVRTGEYVELAGACRHVIVAIPCVTVARLLIGLSAWLSTCSPAWNSYLLVCLLAWSTRLEYSPRAPIRNAPQQSFTGGFHDRPSLKTTTKHADSKTPSKALFSGDLIHH